MDNSINPDFEKEYDKWDGKNKKIRFTIGKTSNPLKKVGVEERNITIDSSKLIRIKKEHSEMKDEIIKRIPEIMNSPIVIAESITKEGRLVLLSDIMSDDNKPIMVVLELNPTDWKGNFINDIRVASSYKRNNTQYLLDNSKILWIEPDKKRTSNWLRSTRVQFPLGLNQTGLIDKIVPQKKSFVKSSIRKNTENDTEENKFSLKSPVEETKNLVAIHKLLKSTDTRLGKLNQKKSYFFKNSKVRDKENRLQVMYHYSDTMVDTFDRKKIGSKTDEGVWGRGFYFSPDQSSVKKYGRYKHEVYLNINNPFEIRTKKDIMKFNNIYFSEVNIKSA